jgi:hypothetical protein
MVPKVCLRRISRSPVALALLGAGRLTLRGTRPECSGGADEAARGNPPAERSLFAAGGVVACKDAKCAATPRISRTTDDDACHPQASC